MANPQPTDAHLRMAHSINEAIMLRDFSKRQRKILDLILRLSWGCGKKYAYIPFQKDFQVAGVYEGDIRKEIDWLKASNIIYQEDAFYWFNKNFDDWQISRVKTGSPDNLKARLGELLSENLKGNHKADFVKHEVKTLQNTNSEVSKIRSHALQNTNSPTSDSASAKEKGGGVGRGTPPIKENDKEITKKGESSSEKDIFVLYDEEIGRITEVIRNTLIDAIDYFGENWVREAIKEASFQGHRRWSYIEGILKNWKEEEKGKRVFQVIDDFKPDQKAEKVWAQALAELEKQVSGPNFRTWLAPTRAVSFKKDEFVIGVPSASVAKYLEDSQRSLIERVIIGLTRPGVKVVFGVLKEESR